MSNLRDFLGGLDPATWTDAKAAYLDDNISTKAPASTALSTATWTSARASNLDNLNATVSSRAPSSTALSTATWTNTRAGYLDAAISTRAPSSTALSTATWTNTRAANLDNLNTTVSSRAPSSTALSTNVWTNTRAGYLDTTVSSRAPASTALSSNVWTTTYRNRIDTTISSRLGTCSVQRLATRTQVNSFNDYDTWTISSVNTGKTFLTTNGAGTSVSTSSALDGGVYGYEVYEDFQGASCRFVNSTNVRYVLMGYFTRNYNGSTTNGWGNWTGSYNNQFYVEFSATQIS